MTSESTTVVQVPERLHFAIPHPADGRALRYHFDEFVIELIDRLTDRLALDDVLTALGSFLPAGEIRMYVAQCLYLDLLDTARNLFRYRFLAEQGISCHGRLSCPQALHPLLVPELRTLPGICLVDAHGPGYRLLRSIWRKREWLRRFSTGTVGSRAGVLPKGPCIAIELAEGADIHLKSDAFWLASGQVDPGQVLFVFERQNAGFFDQGKQQDLIEALGAHSVALHPAVSAAGRIPVWKPPASPAWAEAARQTLVDRSENLNRWARKILMQCVERVAYWEAFFRHYSVAVVQNFTEMTADNIAKRIAIGRIGGIEMGKMRSEIFERSGAAFHFKHEVACVWHRNVVPMLEYSRTRPNVVLETGYVYDYLFAERAVQASALRKRLQARGVKKIIAAFDNAAHQNGHFSGAHSEDYYQCLADLVASRQDLGVIIKPKKHIRADRYRRFQRIARVPGLGWLGKRYRLEMPAIEGALAMLMESGRCIELTGVMANVIDSGLAADIVTGIPCSTAACEAALAGRPLVMYDPSSARGNPVCEESRQVSFGTIAGFRDRVVECLDKGLPDTALDDMLAQLDPIRDGHSAARAGAFIAAYLANYAAGHSKARCLECATKAFSAQGAERRLAPAFDKEQA